MNEYNPTKKEKAILAVAINPEYLELNIEKKCKKAGVAKGTWYTAMHKPEFVELVRDMSLAAIKSNVANLLNATLKYAVSDARCASDRKTLLTVLGLYSDKLELLGVALTKEDLNKRTESEKNRK